MLNSAMTTIVHRYLFKCALHHTADMVRSVYSHRKHQNHTDYSKVKNSAKHVKSAAAVRTNVSVDVSVCLSVCLWVCMCVCVLATLMLHISETKRFSGLCPIGILQDSAHGASIGDIIDDVTWVYDVVIVTSQYSKSSHSETRSRINYPCGSFTCTLL